MVSNPFVFEVFVVKSAQAVMLSITKSISMVSKPFVIEVFVIKSAQ